jgi:hypothetical protein
MVYLGFGVYFFQVLFLVSNGFVCWFFYRLNPVTCWLSVFVGVVESGDWF